MKALLPSYQLKMAVSAHFILLTVLLAGCSILPTDDYRENLTLDAAQSLVSFHICTPGYISPGLNTTPKIIYTNDAANVPEERYIRLQYEDKTDQKRVLEVYQKFTNEQGMKTQYPDAINKSLQEGAKVDLLDWVFHPRFLADSEIRDLMRQTRIEASAYQAGQIVWWLYEIVEPAEYRSTMTRWINSQVEYRILSILSVEEITKITESMMKCSYP